jgi:DNA-directed RNA polymerase beta subunit
VIPERGSWIEINVTKKDSLTVRIDQSGKFSAMTLLRAMDPKLSTNADLAGGLLREVQHQDRRRQERGIA